ncbi:hypothetical protein COOONC_18571 [Cooperia oncophora]
MYGKQLEEELAISMESLVESCEAVADNKLSKRCRDAPLNGTCMILEAVFISVWFPVLLAQHFFVVPSRRTESIHADAFLKEISIVLLIKNIAAIVELADCKNVWQWGWILELYRDTYGSKHMRRTQSETFTQQQEDPNGFTEGNVVPHDSSVLMSKATARQLLSFSQTSSSFKRGLEEMVSYFEEDDGACEAQFQYPESTKPSPVMSSTASIPPTNLKRESIESAASGNMIEMMVKSYEEMLERRRLFYCPSSIRDILGGTKPTVRPACYFGERVRRDRLRVDIALLVEFLNSISPFPHLTLDDKVALMKKFSVSFSILEKYYITMRVGGLQTNRIFHSDGTYSDLDDPDSIAKEANRVAGGGVDRNTLNKLFIQSLKDFLLELSVPMYHNKMTDVEFCALNAVLLFDPGSSAANFFVKRGSL